MTIIEITGEQIDVLQSLAATSQIEVGIGFSIDHDLLIPESIRMVSGTETSIQYPSNFGRITAHLHPKHTYSQIRYHPPSYIDIRTLADNHVRNHDHLGPYLGWFDRAWDMVIGTTGTIAYRGNAAFYHIADDATRKGRYDEFIDVLETNTNNGYVRLAQPPGIPESYVHLYPITIQEYITEMKNLIAPNVGLEVLYFAPHEAVKLPVTDDPATFTLNGATWAYPQSVRDCQFYLENSDSQGYPYGDRSKTT